MLWTRPLPPSVLVTTESSPVPVYTSTCRNPAASPHVSVWVPSSVQPVAAPSGSLLTGLILTEKLGLAVLVIVTLSDPDVPRK